MAFDRLHAESPTPAADETTGGQERPHPSAANPDVLVKTNMFQIQLMRAMGVDISDFDAIGAWKDTHAASVRNFLDTDPKLLGCVLSGRTEEAIELIRPRLASLLH
ncbi:MAG: hypothetical protein V1723_01520 [Candidatus Uhrbacteria bacterium]